MQGEQARSSGMRGRMQPKQENNGSGVGRLRGVQHGRGDGVGAEGDEGILKGDGDMRVHGECEV